MTPEQKVKAYRQIKGWSISEAARRWDIAPSTLGDIERGRRRMGPTVAYRIEQKSNGDLKDLWSPRPRAA